MGYRYVLFQEKIIGQGSATDLQSMYHEKCLKDLVTKTGTVLWLGRAYDGIRSLPFGLGSMVKLHLLKLYDRYESMWVVLKTGKQTPLNPLVDHNFPD